MKLAAVAQRGSKKDFVDVYALGRRFGLGDMLAFYGKKFGAPDVGHGHRGPRLLRRRRSRADADAASASVLAGREGHDPSLGAGRDARQTLDRARGGPRSGTRGVPVTRPMQPAAAALVLSLLGGVLDGRPEAEASPGGQGHRHAREPGRAPESREHPAGRPGSPVFRRVQPPAAAVGRPGLRRADATDPLRLVAAVPHPRRSGDRRERAQSHDRRGGARPDRVLPLLLRGREAGGACPGQHGALLLPRKARRAVRGRLPRRRVLLRRLRPRGLSARRGDQRQGVQRLRPEVPGRARRSGRHPGPGGGGLLRPSQCRVARRRHRRLLRVGQLGRRGWPPRSARTAWRATEAGTFPGRQLS